MGPASKIILASASPRRRELLAGMGVNFDCEPADIDEVRADFESPDTYVLRMAREKAQAVRMRHADTTAHILAADTSVIVDSDVLGKPTDREHARHMLRRLSARRHQVASAICLDVAGVQQAELISTEVEFVTLSAATIEAYLATDEPWDKAGAYAIQGIAGAFVQRINGSYSNVVGLPLAETWALLSANGIGTAFDGPDS